MIAGTARTVNASTGAARGQGGRRRGNTEGGVMNAKNYRSICAGIMVSLVIAVCACDLPADSFTLGFNATSASADPGGLVQIGYSFTNDNPLWWALVSNVSADLPASSLIETSQVTQSRFVVDPLSTLS